MSLPATFTFSQSSFQDYTDCARRFELRYLDRLRWPAVRAEPVLDHERNLQRGERFHHLLHQHLLEIPAGTLAKTLTDDPPLVEWWSRVTDWLNHTSLPGKHYPEMTLSVGTGIPTPPLVPLSPPSAADFGRGARGEGDDDDEPPPPEYRLMAKYDLLAIEPGGRAVIIDWKTTAPQSREALERRWQTMVYRWVLAQAGQDLNGGQHIPPERIEMIYWYTTGAPVTLRYDAATFERDGLAIRALIEQINQTTSFPLTTDERRCRFCTYRSLCDRGRAAGDLESEDLETQEDGTLSDLHIDLEQVAEVEF